MELTTDQVVALLGLVASLTEERDAANARFQGLDREWDEYQDEQRRQRDEMPDAEDVAIMEVLRTWSRREWQWRGERREGVQWELFSVAQGGEWEVKFVRSQGSVHGLLSFDKGEDKVIPGIMRRSHESSRLAALTALAIGGWFRDMEGGE